MKRFALLFGMVALVAACARADMEGGGDTTTAAGTVVPTISYADVAGRWTVNVMPEMGDSVLTTYELNASADTTGWTATFPAGTPIPIHVMPPTADSIVTHMGPYTSVLRPGVQVTTTAVLRLRDGKMVGTAVARYNVTTADSVVTLRAEGTRIMQ